MTQLPTQLPKLVVFEMAGTTVEDHGEVPAAFTAALARHGIDVTAEQVNAVRGASKRQAVLNLLPETADRIAKADEVYASFKDEQQRRFSAGVKPIPGAAEALSWLREGSISVALNTGFDREIVELLLAILNWKRSEFAAVVCGDDVPQGRPAPWLIFRCMEAARVTSVHEVAVVGDTTLDLEAAHNAGARWNIGVLSGAHSRDQMAHRPHTHLLASVAELPTIWSAR
jgi:phosphonatase-like hydrolase